MDRDKVINDLQDAVNDDWMWQHADYYAKAMENAIALLKEDCHNCKLECLLQKYDELKEKYDALLKEQNPITQSNGSCPNCGWDFENGDLEFSSLDLQKFYCPNCGQALKWD